MVTEQQVDYLQSRPFLGIALFATEGTTPWEGKLSRLGLSFESTIEDVQRVAISLRVKSEGTGVESGSVLALRDALRQAQLCKTDTEFISFFFSGVDFENLRSDKA